MPEPLSTALCSGAAVIFDEDGQPSALIVHAQLARTTTDLALCWRAGVGLELWRGMELIGETVRLRSRDRA